MRDSGKSSTRLSIQVLDDAASGLRNLIDAIDQDHRAGYELAVDPLLRHSVHNVG